MRPVLTEAEQELIAGLPGPPAMVIDLYPENRDRFGVVVVRAILGG